MADYPELNAVYLETMLRKAEKERSVRRILEVSSVPAVAQGENYCGVIHRAELKVMLYSGDTDVIKAIVKVAPDDKARAKIVQQFGSYRVEMLMYNTVLPAMERLMITRGDWRDTLWCRYYAGHPYDTLILEDLKYKGYVTGDRIKGLDFEHAEAAVRGLARFHAMSKVMYDNDELDINVFGDCFFARKDNQFIAEFTTSSIKTFAKIVETTWPPEWKETSERLMKAADNITERLAKLLKRDDNGFNVLNHGDPWTTNMMYQYDQYTRKITGIKFVDYQHPHFNSPIIDLLYFLHSSIEKQLIVSRLNHLLKTYHEELENTFRSLNHKVSNMPSFEGLKNEFYQKYAMCLPVSTVVLPIVRSQSGIDLQEALENSGLGNEEHLFVGKAYSDIMRHLLPEMVAKGVI